MPAGTAAAVREQAAGKLDPGRIVEIETRTRHDVIAFLTHVEELAGEPARWLHLGMTSSDVLDASLAILLRRGGRRDPRPAIDVLRGGAGRAAEEHRDTPMIGRSHGIHAEPITAGLVFAGFYGELGRARRALARAREEIAVGKIAGAVGTYANLDPAIEAAGAGQRWACTRRWSPPRSSPATATPATSRRWPGWAPPSSASPSPCATGSAPRSARPRRPSARARRARRPCPTRRTPSCRRTCAGWRACCAPTPGAALENVALWHERDISHSSVERVIGPDATGLADFMVRRAAGLIEGLVVERRAHAREPGAHRRARASARRCCWRWWARAWPARRPTSWCRSTRWRAARALERAGFRELLGADPEVGAPPERRRARPAASTSSTTCATSDAIIDRALRRSIRIGATKGATTWFRDDVLDAQLTRTLDGTDFPEPGREVRGQGARLLHHGTAAPHHRGDRPHQRLRRRAGHHPLQGPGAEPASPPTGSSWPARWSPTTCVGCPIRR